jgi:hypothetical protein
MARPPKPGASLRRAACAVAIAALAVSCASSPDTEALGDHPLQPQLPPIVAPRRLPDTRHVPLGAVAGTPLAWPIAVHGGDLTLRGTVTGPAGPVAGARVLLERFVGERSGRLEVRTAPSGAWLAIGVHGGRYRVRAWHAPDLAMSSSQVLFVAVDDAPEIDLTVERYAGRDVTADVDTTTPVVGTPATVTALVTHQQVDPAGIITTAPASGRNARITPIGPWHLEGGTSAVIDDAGRVSWALTCTAEGSVSARVDALGRSATVSATCTVPQVEPPPVDPPRPDFPVGDEFTPPFAGPIPAGTYTVVDSPGTCGLTYEAWAGDHWDPVRRTVAGTGDVTLPDIARDLQTLGDSPPCTYRRSG